MRADYLTARALAVVTAGSALFVFDALTPDARAPSLPALPLVALWGGHVAFVGAVALVGAAIAGASCAVARLRRRPPSASMSSALTAFAAALPVHLAMSELARGDWISKQPWAPLAHAGGVVLGTAVLGLLAHAYFATCPSESAPSPRGSITAAIGLLVAALSFAVVDVLIAPGLYAPAHLLAFGSSAATALLSTCRLIDGLRGARRFPVALRACAGALIAAALATTLILLPRLRSPLVLGSRAAAVVLPLLPDRDDLLSTELERLTPGRPSAPAQPVDRGAVEHLLRGRRDYNVILVVVDTLRADALPPARGTGSEFARPGDTPFLDRWLDDAFVFRRAYAQSSQTRRSIPPTFRSIEACDDINRVGTPLGIQAALLGFVPVAVVPQYFLMPESQSAQQLLVGFERVDFYEKDQQQQLVPKVRDLLDGLAGQRFFAWIHFYNMHQPYFAGRLLGARDGTAAERYRKALGWLDEQMHAFHRVLVDQGLDDDTVVMFIADHGENLGQRGRTGHGATVFEPEIRVPMAIAIPDQPGGVIESTVGNIDVVPTLLDVAGAPVDARHRGTSLLPWLAARAQDRPLPADLPYYFENNRGTMQGIGLGDDKLVRRTAPRVFHRFDVATDPGELRDGYDPDGATERSLRRAMLYRNPNLFADALGADGVVGRLRAHLASVDPDHVDLPTLELLLKLAAAARDASALAEGERVLRTSRNLAVTLAAAQHLFPTDPDRFSSALLARLDAVAGTDAEAQLVDGLARQGQPPFAMERIALRLAAIARGEPQAWAPWLRLLEAWPKPAALFLAPLSTMLQRVALPLPREQMATLLLVLSNVRGLVDAPDPTTAAALAARVAPFIDDANGRVGVEAVRAFATLRPPGASARLREELTDTAIDVRVRQALLHALARVEGAAAAPVIAQQGESRLLTVDAVQILGELGNPVALPFLETTAKRHYNAYTRDEARKAADKIKSANRTR